MEMHDPQRVPFAQILLVLAAAALASSIALIFQLDSVALSAAVVVVVALLAWFGLKTWRDHARVMAFNAKTQRGAGLVLAIVAIVVGLVLIISTLLEL